MAEIATVTGTLVGFEQFSYGDKFDRATGEKLRSAGEMRFVWVSAPDGEGPPVQLSCWEDRFAEAQSLGFGTEVTCTYMLDGGGKGVLRRNLRSIEASPVPEAASA